MINETRERPFPNNLFYELGIDEHAPQTDDFWATLNYVLLSVTSERNAKIVLSRYVNGNNFDEIGIMYEITKQRAQSIVQTVLDSLRGEYADMLAKGIRMYYDDLLEKRIGELLPLVKEEERNEIVATSYAEGYRTGYSDGACEKRVNSGAKPIDTMRIETLGISVRSLNSLTRSGVHTLGQLVEIGDKVIDFPSFGKTSFHEMANLLHGHGVNVPDAFPRAVRKFDWSEPNE